MLEPLHWEWISWKYKKYGCKLPLHNCVQGLCLDPEGQAQQQIGPLFRDRRAEIHLRDVFKSILLHFFRAVSQIARLLKDPVDSIAPPSRSSLTPFEAAFCHHLCCSCWHNIFGLPLENYWDVCLEFSKLVWFDFGITHKGTDWWMILQRGAFSWALPLAGLQSKCHTVDFVDCHYLPRR